MRYGDVVTSAVLITVSSMLLLGCNSDRKAIEKVAQEIHATGIREALEQGSKTHGADEFIKLLGKGIHRLEQIDVTACPKDFQIAYVDLKGELAAYYRLVRRIRKNYKGVLGTFKALIYGSEIEAEYEAQVAKLLAADQQLDKIAIKYGADVGQNK